MQNVDVKMDGKILTLKVDTSKPVGDSKSGKSTILGMTGGEYDAGGGIFINLTVYKKKGK